MSGQIAGKCRTPWRAGEREIAACA